MAAKIDTQGCEYHVYKGGCEIFGDAELIVLEYWPYAVKRMGGDIFGLNSILQEDLPYAALLREDQQFNPAELLKFSDLIRNLKFSTVQLGEMAWIDLVLTKRRI